MPAVSRKGDMSTGHGPWAPTAMISTPVKKTYFNGKLAGVVDAQCQFAEHIAPIMQIHPASIRTPSEGAGKTNIEGKPAARIGDALADGDTIAEGSNNTFIE